MAYHTFRSRGLLFLLVLLPFLGGCARDADPPASRPVTDVLGRTVAWPDTVQRIVTLAPNLTEMVYTAGAGSLLVGVSTADDVPPAVDTLPRFSALPVDFERIATLRPDVVLATDQINNPRDADTFAMLDIPVYFFHFGTLDDVTDGLRRMGDLLGTTPAAHRAADSLLHIFDTLRAWSDTLDARRRVLLLAGDEPLYAFGAGSYTHDLIDLAGGISLTADVTSSAPILSEEFVLEARPDVIIGAFGEDYDPDRLLALHPTWDVVPAIRDGRVISLDPDLLVRPGPRLAAGAFAMARALHPASPPPFRTALPSEL